MHQHFFEHRNDHTLPKNVAIVDGFEDIMKFQGRDHWHVDARLFSALRGPKMLYKTGNFLSALGLKNPYAKQGCTGRPLFVFGLGRT